MPSSVKKEVKLYDGKITIAFSSLARNRYTVLETGSSPVGVTTLLQTLAKEGLMLWPMYEAIDWLKKHPEDYEGALKAHTIKSDSGKDVGSAVHAAIEKFLGGEHRIKLDARGQKAFMAFSEWYKKTEPKVLATEQIVYSKQHDYAGTYDALMEIGEKVMLVDIKTSNASRSAPLGIYPEYLLQLGAYSLAHHEENPQEKIDDAMIVRVGKDGVLNTLSVSDLGLKLSYLEDTFKHLVQVYRFLQPLIKVLKERTQ